MVSTSLEEARTALDRGDMAAVRHCNLCDFPIGFRRIDGQLYFDTACECTLFHLPLEPREESELSRWFQPLALVGAG